MSKLNDTELMVIKEKLGGIQVINQKINQLHQDLAEISIETVKTMAVLRQTEIKDEDIPFWVVSGTKEGVYFFDTRTHQLTDQGLIEIPKPDEPPQE
jgi:hypothetical protein